MKPKMLVPFDFSPTAEKALVWAADFQRTTGSPPILMIHAVDTRPAGTAEAALAGVAPTADEIAALERSMVEKTRGHEGAATAAVWSRASNVGDIILNAAKDVRAELIVMGSHGRTGITRLVLGSVAEHVLRHASCPVVIVRAPK